MNATQIVEALKSRKGQHVRATWQRTLKTLKDVPMVVTKRTSVWVRAGINYANLTSVREGIESGEREEVQPLKWGTWAQFPFIITHKGNDYVRLYPAVFENLKTQTRVEFFVDGLPASRESAQALCLASEFRDREDELTCFTLKAENILEIGD